MVVKADLVEVPNPNLGSLLRLLVRVKLGRYLLGDGFNKFSVELVKSVLRPVPIPYAGSLLNTIFLEFSLYS